MQQSLRAVQSVIAFVRDLRHGVRVLIRNPLFTVTAIVLFAVGLGVNAAIFSLVDTLLLRPLPYPEPSRLELVSRVLRSQGTEDVSWAQDGRTWQVLSGHVHTADLAPFSDWPTGVNLVADGVASYVQEQRVGAGFFRVLGVRPALGRGFTAEEDVPGGARVAVLSHGLWQRDFGADPGILGETVALKGEPFTVVGVMPAGFRSTSPAELWTPLRPSTTGEGGGANYGILVRPRPGVPAAEAEAEIAALGARVWEEERASWPEGLEVRYSLDPLQTGLTTDLRQPLALLWAAVVLALVVVCANLAGLTLARSAGRRREMAARMALGGGRSAVVRAILAESVLVAVAGTVLGVGLGRLALEPLTALARDALGIWQPVTLDLRVLGATALVALSACIGFGLWPALAATRIDLRAALAQGGPGAASGGASPLDSRVSIAGDERRIVGVVGNVLYDPSGLGGSAPLGRLPVVYVPSSQVADQAFVTVHTWFEPSWVVRSALDPDATVAALRRAVHAVAPELPFARFRRLDQVEADALGEQRFLMSMVVVLAGVATLLAALGIYGLIAGSVTERTRELGVRLALGATRAQVLRAVVVPGVALTAAGTVLGVALALAGARFVESLVYGVAPTDPWTLGAGALAVLLVATVASLIPGLGVLDLDPARTLREE